MSIFGAFTEVVPIFRAKKTLLTVTLLIGVVGSYAALTYQLRHVKQSIVAFARSNGLVFRYDRWESSVVPLHSHLSGASLTGKIRSTRLQLSDAELQVRGHWRFGWPLVKWEGRLKGSLSIEGQPARPLFASLRWSQGRIRCIDCRTEAFGGDLRISRAESGWDFRIKRVDAHSFLKSAVGLSKPVLSGPLSLSIRGESLERFHGTWSLKGEGKLAWRLADSIAAAARKIPFVGSTIDPPNWDETIVRSTGQFRWEKEQLFLSEVLHETRGYTLQSQKLDVKNEQINGQMMLQPKPPHAPWLQLLEDRSGKIAVLLALSGPVTSPTVSPDAKAFQNVLGNWKRLQASPQFKATITRELKRLFQ